MARIGNAFVDLLKCPVCGMGVSMEFSVQAKPATPFQPGLRYAELQVAVNGMRLSHDCTPVRV